MNADLTSDLVRETEFDRKSPVNKAALGSVYRNAFALTVVDLASKGSAGILSLLIARFMGPYIFGEYAAAASVTDLFFMITGIGLEQEFTRRGGRVAADIPKVFNLTLRAIALTSSIAVIGLLVLVSVGVYSSQINALILLLSLFAIATRFHLPFRYLCLLLQRAWIAATVQSTSTFILLGTSLLLLFSKSSIELIVTVQAAVSIGVLWWWFRWLSTQFRSETGRSAESTVGFIRNAVPFAITTVLWIAYFNFDAFLLSLMSSSTEVGTYAGVYRIISIHYVLGYALVNSFTPQLFERHGKRHDHFTWMARHLVFATIVVGAILAVLLYLGSNWLVTMILGASYIPGVVLAQILSVAVFFRLINYGLCEVLTTSDRHSMRICLEGSLLLVNVILNLLLIPDFGGVGAAIATVAAEVVLTIGVIWVCVSSKVFVKDKMPAEWPML